MVHAARQPLRGPEGREAADLGGTGKTEFRDVVFEDVLFDTATTTTTTNNNNYYYYLYYHNNSNTDSNDNNDNNNNNNNNGCYHK